MLPSLFISHGAPDLVLAGTDAARFLAGYGGSGATPDAYLVASAHFESASVRLSGDAAPETIYDFGGFDPRLRELTYDAPGNPALAQAVSGALKNDGYDASVAQNRGYDHGTWVPLMLMRPQADIPVVQVSVDPARDAAWHFHLGRALRQAAPDGVQIIGSGSFTHNLAALFGSGAMAARDAEAPEWVTAFEEWMAGHLLAGDLEPLLDYRNRAPYAAENHPTEEHIAPLFVALGAAREGRAEILHESHEFGVLAMSAFAFH